MTFFAGAIVCMCMSFIFHTVNCHQNKFIGQVFAKLDYCGIAFLIVGSFVPWLYYSFYCDYYTQGGLPHHSGCVGNHLCHRQSVGQVRLPKIAAFQSWHFHHLWPLWDRSGDTLLNSEWLGEINQRSRPWLARLHGLPLHFWRNALCIQNTRALLPWQSGHPFPFAPTFPLLRHCWGFCSLPRHLQYGTSQASRRRMPAAEDRPLAIRVITQPNYSPVPQIWPRSEFQ